MCTQRHENVYMHLHIDIYIIYTQNTRNATDSRKVGSGAGTTAITTYPYIHTRTHNYMHLHNIDIHSKHSRMPQIHEKLDQVLELEKHRGSDRKRRIEELEKQVADLTSQRSAVLTQYKRVVDESDKLMVSE